MCKKLVTVLLLVLLVGVGVYLWQQNPAETEEDAFGIPAGQEEEVKAAHEDNMNKNLCEDSGGTYTEGNCSCPADYNLENNECIDAFGLPGGDRGEEIKAAHEDNMNKNLCEDSGGTYTEGNCSCPADYNLENNECIDAFGLPGGDRGEEIKANQADLMESDSR